jgi:hypothetical protein
MKPRAAIALAAFILTSNSLAAAQTQCAPAEHIIFSCSIGAKIVSVCAADKLTTNTGALSYRFGPPGKPEITWPPASTWRDATRSGTWMFSGGGGAWLAFHREAFRYIVYTAIGKGWGSKAGLAVEQNGKLLANMSCRGEPVSQIGPDLFASAGIAEDMQEFELPQ